MQTQNATDSFFYLNQIYHDAKIKHCIVECRSFAW